MWAMSGARHSVKSDIHSVKENLLLWYAIGRMRYEFPVKKVSSAMMSAV